VGKSLAARWIAKQLNLPLLMLDLSAVISSFLGKTGVNVRQVLDYAKGLECVLFLDELDAVAKRRDDAAEIGELKRLVTVLLQEIDDWPPTGLLIAATNHAGLLDPAIWRRFDVLVQFPMPEPGQAVALVESVLGDAADGQLYRAVAAAFSGQSFSEIERELLRVKREAVIHSGSITDSLLSLARARLPSETLELRREAALRLLAYGMNQTDIHVWTGLHRDVVRQLQQGIGIKPRRGRVRNAKAKELSSGSRRKAR
jgi:SpoVK/Ycf46/Vps4 family AAA+-type ATPase